MVSDKGNLTILNLLDEMSHAVWHGVMLLLKSVLLKIEPRKSG